MYIPIISKFLAQRRSKNTNYERHTHNWSARTAAGIYISPDRSLRDSTIWAAHRYVTQTVGQLPFRIMKPRLDDSGSDRYKSPVIHPVDYVLNRRPNPELSPLQFKETLTGWAILWGNGYAEIELDGVGRVKNLWLIEPWRVQVKRDEDGTMFYLVDNETRFELYQIFHIRGFGNGPVGLSVIEYAAQTIGWAQATELFGSTYFGEGMHFGGAVKLKGKGSTNSLLRMKDELENQHKGVGRSNRWVFLDNDADIVKTTFTPDESQFIETMQHQVETICRWMGVPPQKVYHLLRMTFNNVEQLAIEVVQDSITPWAIRFEEEATYKLFGSNRQNLFVKMDLKGLLRGDFQTRQTGLQIMRRNGIINADDWADLEDMPRPTGNGSDKYIVEGNMTTLEKVGEDKEEKTNTPEPDDLPSPQISSPTPGTLRLLQMYKSLNQRLLTYVE